MSMKRTVNTFTRNEEQNDGGQATSGAIVRIIGRDSGGVENIQFFEGRGVGFGSDQNTTGAYGRNQEDRRGSNLRNDSETTINVQFQPVKEQNDDDSYI